MPARLLIGLSVLWQTERSISRLPVQALVIKGLPMRTDILFTERIVGGSGVAFADAVMPVSICTRPGPRAYGYAVRDKFGDGS